MKDSYDDIIDLEYPIRLNRPRMSRRDRAAQFSPFAALSGYDDAIKEAEGTVSPETRRPWGA